MRTKSQFRKGKAPGKTSSPIRRDLDTLIQGISQQPPHLRSAGQGARQLNGWSSPVEGLTKRNAMRLQSRILDTPITDFYLEMMDIRWGEQYSILLRPGASNQTLLDIRHNGITPAIKVHGTGLTLNGSGDIECDNTSYPYNDPGTFYKNYALINSGPIGLLLNREKVVAYDPATVAPQTGKGLVFVRAVAYNVTYSVRINGTERATYTTPKADDADNKISTSKVAEELQSQLNAVSGYTATVEQYVVQVVKDDRD